MTMRKAAKLTDPARTLREALYQMVHHSGVEIDVQAEQIGIKPKTLYNYANADLEEDGYHYPLKHLLPHARLTDNPVVIQYLAHQLGYALVPVLARHVPSMQLPTIRTPEAILRQLGKVSKEFGQATAATLKAMEDGRVTRREAVHAEKETWELIEQAAVLLHEFKAVMERAA